MRVPFVHGRANLWCMLALALTASCSFGVGHGAAGHQHFFVDPSGGEPGLGQLLSPFRSLAQAQRAVRTSLRLQRMRNVPESITVFLRGGQYDRRHGIPLHLTARDSGLDPAHSVVWRAFPGENVLLSGGVAIPAASFKPYGSSSHLMSASLSELNISRQDLGILVGGGLQDCQRQRAALYFNSAPMVLARYPNIASNGSWQFLHAASAADNKILYTGDSIKHLLKWSSESQPWVHGYWSEDWWDSFAAVTNVTHLDNGTVQLTISQMNGAAITVKKGARFLGINLLSELDQMGEYFIDDARMELIFYHPDKVAGGRLHVKHPSVRSGSRWTNGSRVASLRERAAEKEGDARGAPFTGTDDGAVLGVARAVVELSGVSNLGIVGVRVEYALGVGINAVNCTSLVVENATVANHGQQGLVIWNGTNCTVNNVTAYGIGCTGVNVTGGDLRTLRPGGNVVDQVTVHHYALWKRTYMPGVFWAGVGNNYSRCHVAWAPHNGFLGGGNEGGGVDCNFDRLHIHNVAFEVSDSGAFYTCGQQSQGWINRGNRISNSLIEHIRNTEPISLGYPSVQGIYLDDQMSGFAVINNTLRDCQAGLLLGGGRRNHIVNNTFVNNSAHINFDNRGMNWEKSMCTSNATGGLLYGLYMVDVWKTPWSTRWPYLQDIPGEMMCYPAFNAIVANNYCGRSLTNRDARDFDEWACTVLDNHFEPEC